VSKHPKTRLLLSLNKSFQRTAVFISGTGSCLQAILEMSEYQNIKLVICNAQNALGLLKAKRFGIETLVFDHPIDYLEIHRALKMRKIQKIFLAGFMKIIPQNFLELWEGHIFNIHPSLLPLHKGLNAFEKSFEAKDQMGATIHHVVSKIDSGLNIFQRALNPWHENLNLSTAYFQLRVVEQHLMREFCSKGPVFYV
jgi:phosphoribosylglycinamide formyltransferase-1